MGIVEADWQEVETVVKRFRGRLSIENQGTLEEYGRAVFDWDTEAEALARHYLIRRHQRFTAALLRSSYLARAG